MKVFSVVALLICTVTSTLAKPTATDWSKPTGGDEVGNEIVWVIPDSGAPAIDYDLCIFDPFTPGPPNTQISAVGNPANEPYPASGFPFERVDLTTNGSGGGRYIGLRVCNLRLRQLEKVVVRKEISNRYGPPNKQGDDFDSPNLSYGTPPVSQNPKPVYGVPGSPYGPHAPAPWLRPHRSQTPVKFNQNSVVPPGPSYGTPPVSPNPKPVYGVPGSPYGPNLPTNFYH